MKTSANTATLITALSLAIILAFTPRVAQAKSLSSEFMEGAVITENGKIYSANMTIMAKKFVASTKARLPINCILAKGGDATTLDKEIALKFGYRKFNKNGIHVEPMDVALEDASALALDLVFTRESMKITSSRFLATSNSAYRECKVDIAFPMVSVGKRKTPVYFGATSPFSNEQETDIQLRFDQGKLIDLALKGSVVCTTTGVSSSGIQTSFDLSSTPSKLKMVAQHRQQFTVQITGDNNRALMVTGYLNKKNNTIRVTFNYQESSYFHGGILCTSAGILKLREGDEIGRVQ